MEVFSEITIGDDPPKEEKPIPTPIEMSLDQYTSYQEEYRHNINIIPQTAENARKIFTDNIPYTLKSLKQWVVHRNKIPFNVNTEYEDKNIPSEWVTFEQAYAICHKYDGVGFRFNNNGIVGIDIDTCIEPSTGKISEEALYIINTLDSYTEISPSGYGVHIYVKADISLPFHKKHMNPNNIVRIVNGKQKTPELELYNTGRYFTVTGNILEISKPIAERSTELQSIIDLYTNKKEDVTKSKLSQNMILSAMFNSKKGAIYQALYNGDISNYKSQSEADLALCNILCYFSNGNKADIGSLFRQSGLMRDKWDEKHGADTYGSLTINKAIANTTNRFSQSADPTSGWEHPIPFKSVDLPTFPVGELPVVISDYVRAVAETTQTAPDMAATASLAILALSLQGKFLIEGKKDWREPLNLYTLIIAPPAERKSAVMALMTEPVKQYEITENEKIAPLIEANKIQKAILERRKKEVEGKVSRGRSMSVSSDISGISEELSQFKEIKPCRLFFDDVTHEKLSGLLSDNNGKIGILSSEGGIFDVLAGRYTGSINIDVFLKAHSGDSIRVDRQGRQSEYIKNPAMTTLIFAQPTVMASLISNGTFHGRGLCARFLYSIPTSTVGHRKFESKPISPVTAERYYNLVETLLRIQNDDPQIITLSSKAYGVLKDFADKTETMLIDELSDILDFGGKFVGAVLRMAALLFLAEYPPSQKTELVLSENFMRSAIVIGEYFLEHAKSAYQLMGADEVTEQCKYIIRQLEKTQPKTISLRDIMRLCQKFKNAETISVPLNRLCEYGYLNEMQNDNSSPGRPHSKSWAVNPFTYK